MTDTPSSVALLPQDPVFFTESALGLIAIAGSIVIAKIYGPNPVPEPQKTMAIFAKANDYVYRERFTNDHARLLLEFVNKPSDYSPLLELEAALTS